MAGGIGVVGRVQQPEEKIVVVRLDEELRGRKETPVDVAVLQGVADCLSLPGGEGGRQER